MKKKKETRFSRLILVIVYMLILIFLLVVAQDLLMNKFSAGEIVREDVYSIKDFNNTVREEELKDQAASNVETVYKKLPQVPVNVRDHVETIFKRLQELRVSNSYDQEQKVALMIREEGLTESGAMAAVSLTYQEANYLEVILTDLTSQWMVEGVKETDLERINQRAKEDLQSFELNENQYLAGVDILESTMIPNQVVDLATTRELQEEARESINPIEVKRGDLLLAEGHRITPSDMDMLSIAGLMEESPQNQRMRIAVKAIGLIGITVIWFFIGSWFMKGYESKETLTLLAILNTICLFLPLFLKGGYLWFLPVMAVTLLITSLVDETTSLFNLFYLLILLQYIYPVDSKFIIVFSVLGWMGILLSRNLVQYGRGRMIGQSVIASLAGSVLLIIIEYTKGPIGAQIWKPVAAIMANGFLSAIIYIGSLPLWENLFNRLTPLKLLELSNPHTPLLKKLIESAPGTYQHSVLVGNIAEAAAQTVGANSLLCRVGAYYHDIGKSKASYYFKENQLDGKNPHDILPPKDSARILKSHVTDGVKMGEGAKLPKEIIDTMKEHHGDTIIRFFYHEAKEIAKESGEEINVKDFQYDGPKPQSKETAILMIADSVEAATRSLPHKNPETLRDMVEKIIKGKYDEGQFTECPLSYREMETIKESMVNSLLRIYHDRIEYPEDEEEEVEE